MQRRYYEPMLLAAFLVAALAGCGQESGEQAAPPQPAPSTEAYPPADLSAPPAALEEITHPHLAQPADPIETTPLRSLPSLEEPPRAVAPMFAERRMELPTEPGIVHLEAPPEQAYPGGVAGESAPRPMAATSAEPLAPQPALEAATEPELMAAPPEPTPESGPAESEPGYEVVRVFYATDRNAIAQEVSVFDASQRGWLAVLSCVALGMCLGAGALLWTSQRVYLGLGAILAAAAALGLYAYHEKAVDFASAEILIGEAEEIVDYGGDRGELHLGVCEVSIPPNHRVGQLEAPSILRFEFEENPAKHVVLMSIERYPADDYFEELSAQIAASEKREALVFVHGFNVGFDDAVRRTAQIAYDLKFAGAPICYSWPSQAKTLAYTVDENNVVWTVPHLKQFLLDVIDRTGAESINLVAHSMGNRALTSAVRELVWELREEGPLFNEIVLAAPDIDAEVFQRDIAPALAQAGKRVTLYASSNDQALAASRAVHGYPRAGESGEKLVVVPGVDTIDVSAIDTSLLGHNYYGDSSTLLYDLHSVIRYSLPPERRNLLRPMLLQSGLKFWVFQPQYGPVASPNTQGWSR